MTVGDLCDKAGISLVAMCDRAFSDAKVRQFQHDYAESGRRIVFTEADREVLGVSQSALSLDTIDEGSRIAYDAAVAHERRKPGRPKGSKTKAAKAKTPKPATPAKAGKPPARKPKFIGNERALAMLPGTLSQVCGKLHRPRELVLKTLQRLVNEGIAKVDKTDEGVVYSPAKKK